NGQCKGDRLQGPEVLSLLSKSEIPDPKWSSLATEAREAAPAMVLLKRVRPSARAGLAEGLPAVGRQDRSASGKLCNYYYITVLINNNLRFDGRPIAV